MSSRTVLPGITALLLTWACAAESDDTRTARTEIAERHGMAPHDIAIRTSGALVLTVFEPEGPGRSSLERESLAEQLAHDLSRLHDGHRHADELTVRFVKLRRSDAMTTRRVSSYSYPAPEAARGHAPAAQRR